MISKRIFVERKKGFETEKNHLFHEIKTLFNLELNSLRYLISYDVFDIEDTVLEKSIKTIFSEPNKDHIIYELEKSKYVIAIETLPGQFDQRADSAMQCIKLINPNSIAYVTTGIVIMFDEEIDHSSLEKLKDFYINKVESREKDLNKLEKPVSAPMKPVEVINGFCSYSTTELRKFYNDSSFAMSFEDLNYIQDYFKNKEKRDPLITEILVLDTYWSDHCRHTTFETMLQNITFEKGNITDVIQQTYEDYLDTRKKLNRTTPLTLMELATINTRLERSRSNLDDLEISDEINACSIYIDVLLDTGETEKWLLMFKNETHNHPTEIEPFGGASTCIGGAIRDPLSGRAYVYQAMRITGASDILAPLEETIPGKLPQRVISTGAAHGYSSYGNQIGLATTYVKEIFHDGFLAKRMEVGAVIGAAPVSSVVRKKPEKDDVIILIGGKTGRDGIGGATGSSKTHHVKTTNEASSEVQKGNAPIERKIQRLFRSDEVTKLIKKSNDFGAGGVSVAIGELADGIDIYLDKVPIKYQGINPTEIAISESQERMAVVVDKSNVTKFIRLCNEENLEATSVAKVTHLNRLRMFYHDIAVCNLSREFLDTSGVRQISDVFVKNPKKENPFIRAYEGSNLKEKIFNMLKSKQIASMQGLSEMFDSSIGRTTVLSPYGGLYKKTKTISSVHTIPVRNATSKTVSMMAYGYDPDVSSYSPYHGSTYAIIDSIAKIVSTGGDYQHIRFSFQEYFERLNKTPEKWGKPFSSLLGAYHTLKEFKLAAIGGKDSMSGTFNEINVPPTLISFAVSTGHIDHVISPEFKKAGNYVYLLNHQAKDLYLPNYEMLKNNYNYLKDQIQNKKIVSALPLAEGGLSEALIKASFGSRIGCEIHTDLNIFHLNYGSVLVEATQELNQENLIYLGKTIQNSISINGVELDILECLRVNEERYDSVYPIYTKTSNKLIKPIIKQRPKTFKMTPVKEVIVLNPVFPGTNCEYDTEAAFKKAGALVKTFVFRNNTSEEIEASLKEFVSLLQVSHILMISGGFSSGDEPDGSGKFIASILRNELVKKAIEKHLENKKLILGICNGFQALIKSGLLPYGKIQEQTESSPTLFKNDINRHVAKFTDTVVSSTKSPWLSSFSIGEAHTIAMSHGEGRFMLDDSTYETLDKNGQIAFQYAQDQHPTNNPKFNINGSQKAIEGIISESGLILGKMGHSERYVPGLFKNIHGNKSQDIFKNAVNYFKGEL